MRYVISKGLTTDKNPVLSSCHVELLNLGCPQVYTTNYDDLIESTYHRLQVPADVIVLPKNVATAMGKRTQVIKFHGDLRHDNTLVLTESSYYGRLDFESPMDLKFRSDLLGKSVLFVGYSFGDINIRVIWFKLMKLMKDIPMEDRPLSYIVRFEPNPVLQLLYEDVGIKTIVLDPNSKANTNEKKGILLAEFLFELATRASSADEFIPGTHETLFLSKYAIDVCRNSIRESKRSVKFPSVSQRFRINPQLGNRRIPKDLRQDLEDCLKEAADPETHRMHGRFVGMALKYLSTFSSNQSVSELLIQSLVSRDARQTIEESAVPWDTIWAGQISEEVAYSILKRFEKEISYHEDDGFQADEDIAFYVDLARRIQLGFIISKPSSDLISKAAELIKRVAIIYSAVATYTPGKDGPPTVETIIEQIGTREGEPEFEDDPPI
jgi:hypothetical protein